MTAKRLDVERNDYQTINVLLIIQRDQPVQPENQNWLLPINRFVITLKGSDQFSNYTQKHSNFHIVLNTRIQHKILYRIQDFTKVLSRWSRRHH